MPLRAFLGDVSMRECHQHTKHATQWPFQSPFMLAVSGWQRFWRCFFLKRVVCTVPSWCGVVVSCPSNDGESTFYPCTTTTITTGRDTVDTQTEAQHGEEGQVCKRSLDSGFLCAFLEKKSLLDSLPLCGPLWCGMLSVYIFTASDSQSTSH